ncbi:MAG: hypothetical protein HYS86_04610 [Candidatus Chisholmbacteria bacterium]|nr:hypothetical protein [Candidatus Chisholmbacteria bacterium]
MRNFSKTSSLAWLGILFLFLLPAIWPIITPGYFPIHDDTQVARVAQMTQALLDGQFPVRWVKDLGYGFGYPIFNFYNPLPYYVGSLFHLVGFSALSATKIMFILPIFAGALGMFLLMKKYVDRVSALIGSLMFTYAPYHAVQIYVRGAVAEYWAIAILPFVIYFFLAKKPLGAGISLALLILAHNLTALMAVAIITILFIIQLATEKTRRKIFFTYLLAATLSLGLAAFFWLPALLEKHFTNVDSMIREEFNAVDHFVSPWQLWSSPWGFGGSSPDEHDGLSFIVGKTQLLLTLIGLLFFAKLKTKPRQFPLYLSALAVLVFSLFMLLPLSKVVWEKMTILDVLQFPWRFLSFINLTTAILSGFAVATLTPVIKKHLPGNITVSTLVLSSLILFVVFSSLRYFQPQFKFPTTDEELLGRTKVKFAVSKLSDEYMPESSKRPIFAVDLPDKRYAIDLAVDERATVILDKTQVLSLNTRLSQPKPIIINIHAFPGWVSQIDNQAVSLETYGPYKLQKIDLPPGDHQLTVRLENTLIRKISNIMSLVTLMALGLWGIHSRHKITNLPLLQYFH